MLLRRSANKSMRSHRQRKLVRSLRCIRRSATPEPKTTKQPRNLRKKQEVEASDETRKPKTIGPTFPKAPPDVSPRSRGSAHRTSIHTERSNARFQVRQRAASDGSVQKRPVLPRSNISFISLPAHRHPQSDLLIQWSEAAMADLCRILLSIRHTNTAFGVRYSFTPALLDFFLPFGRVLP